MTTKTLLHDKSKEMGYSKMKLQDEIGCTERTLREYFNGSTTHGKYLTKLLAVLKITVEEWNDCDNVKENKKDK